MKALDRPSGSFGKTIVAILRDGLKKGLLAWFKMTRFVFPVVAVMAYFQGSVGFEWVVRFIEPVMAGIGLPGVAAFAIVTGLLINKFAGIAGLLVLPLSRAQFMVAAILIALAHNVPSEMMIVWESRLPVVRIGLLRVGVGCLTALTTHGFLQLTGWLSTAPLSPMLTSALHGNPPLLQATYTVLKMAYFLLPLFLLLETLRHLNLLPKLEAVAQPLMRSLRLPPSLTSALLAGLVLGVATGAGLIGASLQEQEQTQTTPPTRRELFQLNVFLLHFHSIFEDTLMFALFPVPLLAIALIRFTVAWLLCRLVS